MVAIGNIFYKHRNWFFPLLYLLLFIPTKWHIHHDYVMVCYIGWCIALIGQIIRWLTVGLKYIIRGGKNRQVYAEDLVTDGIFAHVRNPLYVGNLLIILGLAFISNSLPYLLVVVPFFIFAYNAIVRAEENFLRNKFGTAYNEYTQNTARWFPNLQGIGETLGSMEFNWKRLIVKEYTSALIWMGGAIILTAVKMYDFSGSTASFWQYSRNYWIAFALLLTAYLSIKLLKTAGKLQVD
ncbi:MAG: isoprenylcysteine carboxylmethyltransferase family protein [Chitinophagales bacterium]|nr:isoprenylcysteine carboxylmethyltransferase family protein [Bacteroidota bacterium]